jgi:hypothetical protein
MIKEFEFFGIGVEKGIDLGSGIKNLMFLNMVL